MPRKAVKPKKESPFAEVFRANEPHILGALAQFVPAATVARQYGATVYHMQRYFRSTPALEKKYLAALAAEPTTDQFLASKLDAILDLIIEGMTQKQIAYKLSVSTTTLSKFLNRTENKPLMLDAYQQAAQQLLDIATDEITKASSREEIMRAKVLTSHLQFCASRYDRGRFGEHLQVDMDSNVAITWQEEKTYVPVHEITGQVIAQRQIASGKENSEK
jgi:transcriptional regulator with XRE-family HTH domain